MYLLYCRVKDVKESKVLGLTGLSYVDKTLPDAPTVTETRSEEDDVHWLASYIGWPRNGYLVISRNTKLDEIKHFFRGISAEFREIPRKDFVKISHIFAKYFC